MAKSWLQNQLAPESRNSKSLLLHLETDVGKANPVAQTQSALAKRLYVVGPEGDAGGPPAPGPPAAGDLQEFSESS